MVRKIAIEVSRLKDEVRNANNYLVHESMAIEDEAIANEFKIEKRETEKYEIPLSQYLKKEITLDSNMKTLLSMY